jgi:predicted nucleic acid-binding protein
MEERYYLDTSVWMDFYEDRKDSSKDIGELAFKLLSKLLASKSKIVVSEFLQMELGTYYSSEEIRGMTMLFEKFIIKAEFSEKQLDEAKRIAGERKLPKGDVVHAIVARDNDAILVSRDKHFQQLKDICKVKKPDEII